MPFLLARRALLAASAAVLAALRTKVRAFTAGGLTGPLSFRGGAQLQPRCTATLAITKKKWTGSALSCRNGKAGPLPTP